MGSLTAIYIAKRRIVRIPLPLPSWQPVRNNPDSRRDIAWIRARKKYGPYLLAGPILYGPVLGLDFIRSL